MQKIAPDTEAEAEELDFKPLTAQEAQEWRKRHPAQPVWRLVAAQALMGVCVALLAWGVSGERHVAWSAGYGALAVVLPAAVFARGMARQRRAAGTAMVGFMGWELVKIMLTVAMLAAAHLWVPQLNWLALVLGMVVTMKTYWVALLVRPGVRKTDGLREE
ncbi:MAG: ATP synthase subunit I [Burkholderiales bacterium]|jgi:ATP synthase protein I|nr:ATP synthase subunit I [Burkholderiales bacterium]